ncbi:transposase [Methylolobus aquaticus]
MGDFLRVLNGQFHFATLAAAIDQTLPRPGRERDERPPFPTDIMVRGLLLQRLYNLKGEQMEFQLLNRLCLQYFSRLRHSTQIPDSTTRRAFRKRLITAGATDTLFDAANRELAKHGYPARGGQIMDVSLIPVPRQRIGNDEAEVLQQQATPSECAPATRRKKNTAALCTEKRAKASHYLECQNSVTPASPRAGVRMEHLFAALEQLDGEGLALYRLGSHHATAPLEKCDLSPNSVVQTENLGPGHRISHEKRLKSAKTVISGFKWNHSTEKSRRYWAVKHLQRVSWPRHRLLQGFWRCLTALLMLAACLIEQTCVERLR